MHHKTATFVLVGAMVGPPATALAAPAEQARGHDAKEISAAPAPTHAVRGVVKSVAPKCLVITRSSKKPSDLFFLLTPSTLRSGTIAAGSTVSVRYRTEGKTLLATAVTADPVRDEP